MWPIWFCAVITTTCGFETLVIHHGRTTGIFQLDSQDNFANNASIEDNGITDYNNISENNTEKNVTLNIRMEDIVFCNLTVIDGAPKEQLLARLGSMYPVLELSFPSMLSAVSACDNMSTSTFLSSTTTTSTTTTTPAPFWKIFSSVSSIFSGSLFSGIVDGTKWCGINDIAEDYHDLGEEWQLDRCCRQHDHCPLKVKAFSKKFGIYNLLSPYTKSHCECDALFYDCLKDVGIEKADKIGRVFFNVLDMQCMELGLPEVCQEYQYFSSDTSQDRQNGTSLCGSQLINNFTIPQNTTTEDSTQNSTMEDNTQNSTMEDNTQNFTMEDNTQNFIMEDNTQNSTVEANTQNFIIEDNTQNFTMEDSTYYSIMEDLTDNSTMEDSIHNSEDSLGKNKIVENDCGRTRKCKKWIPDVTKNPRLMFVKKKRSY